jgi:hypothetical protein
MIPALASGVQQTGHANAVPGAVVTGTPNRRVAAVQLGEPTNNRCAPPGSSGVAGVMPCSRAPFRGRWLLPGHRAGLGGQSP